MSQFDQMRTFVRVVEAGSISRAAEQMGLAKSGVSRRLSDLESRLGVRLIQRTTRRSRLTEAGQAYYTGAVKLLGDVDELEAATADAEAVIRGTLRLAAPLSFGLCHLSPAMDEFMRQNPQLEINVDFSDRRIDLVERGMDLAIRIAQLEDSNLQARRICPIRLLLCASPAYLAEYGTPTRINDLKRHRILRYEAGGVSSIRLRDHQGRVHSIQTGSHIVANNGDFLRDMAMAGHGIIMSPSFITWQALASGDLVPVMTDFKPPPLEAWAVYPRNRYLSRRARSFIDFLVERFGDNPYWDQYSQDSI
jgi:DNA-binding transcriptional LysR family regulator